ncbi:MAG: hypothetical protein AB7P07_06480 [Hyphomonadaceae bacterium]
MSGADGIAARLIQQLERLASAEAEGGAPTCVSVTLTYVANGDATEISTKVGRKTRTMLFLEAEARDRHGAPIARADSVHRILS